jgi:putative acetyltransferase
MPVVKIEQEDPNQAEVRRFFAASEAYMSQLYPAESNHFIDLAALRSDRAVFLVARIEGLAAGCGAIVFDQNQDCEIKRMWVDPHWRGHGVASKLLEGLLGHARRRGSGIVRLETGIHQPEALGLYRRAGFAPCGPFGSYRADPLSIFMALPLRQTQPA